MGREMLAQCEEGITRWEAGGEGADLCSEWRRRELEIDPGGIVVARGGKVDRLQFRGRQERGGGGVADPGDFFGEWVGVDAVGV